MSDDSIINKELELLGQNFSEVLNSTAAVKGAEFANAVALHFECAQMVDAVGGLALMAQEIDEDRTAGLLDAVKHILTSIATKACGDLSESEFKESVALAKTLHERRNQAVKKINQELRNDD